MRLGRWDNDTLERWEKGTRWPLVACALLYLIAYAIPIANPDVSPAVNQACTWVMYGIWIAFGVDYLVRIAVSSDRWGFFRSHLLDLVVVALPMLRPLSLLRAFMVMQVLNRAWRQSTRNQVIMYATGASLLMILMGALTITETERYAAGSTITNLGTGFWWTITTMTTVGYGDTYPVTTTGRVIAAVLMIGGITMLGVLTATLSSWLVERVTDEDERKDVATDRGATPATRAEVAALTARVEQLLAAMPGEPGEKGDPR